MTADELTAAILGFTLGMSAGWCWGHSTARVRHVPVGALATDDEAALDEAWIAERRTAFEERLGPVVDLDDGESPFGWRAPATPTHDQEQRP